MSCELLDLGRTAAWFAATNQEAQLGVVSALFPGSVELRYYSAAGTLLDTVTHSGWDMSATNPRFLSPRGISARSFAASAAAAYVIAAVPGGAEILRADVALSGNVAASRRTNLGAGSGADGLRIVANGALPVNALPAWLAGAAVNSWAQISGTAAPNDLKDYCGLAARGIYDASGEVWFYSAAAGGHGGNIDRQPVQAIRLDVDTPSAWQTIRAADSPAGWDITGTTSAYFPSGKPAPRHTYTDVLYVPEHNRISIGGRFWGTAAADWTVQDGFRLSDNDWDAAGTYANRPTSGTYLEALDPATGIWYGVNGWRWTPGANPAASSYTAFALSGSPTVGVMGSAFDTLRGRIFHLSAGNNISGGTAINSCVINISTGVKTAISYNASAAWTQFQADAAASHFLGSTVVFDPTGDCFYFYNGGGEGTTKVYKVTPNGTTTWDMSLLDVTGGPPGLSISLSRGGVLTKFRYIDRWRVLVLAVPSENIWYLKVA